MKKIMLLIGLLLFPFMVVSADGTDQYIIDAYIQENGDMKIYEFKKISGTYNGYKTQINYQNNSLGAFTGIQSDFGGSDIYNASNLVDLKVYATNSINDESGREFTKVTSANIGESGVYTESLTNGGYDLTIYQPSSYNLGSLVTYTLKDVVVVHNDVAEIAWDFIGSNYQERIESLTITIHLPGNNSQGNLRVFSHGPLTGNNRIIDQSTVEATYTNVPAYQAIDVRVVFDLNLVRGASKRSNVMGLANILAYEEEMANKANEIREYASSLVTRTNVISGILFGLGIALIIYIYLKHDKEYKSSFLIKYNRDFINDYNVEVVDYIMTNTVSQNAFSAAIMNLVYEKYLTIEKVLNGKKEVYQFTKTNKECTDPAQKYLLDFLIDDIGDKTKFDTDKMKSYAGAEKTYTKFTTKYETWRKMVLKTGEELNIYEKKNGIKSLGSVLAIISIVVCVYLINSVASTILPVLTIIFYIILIIYIASFKKRTVKGNDHYVRWKAFKNFLNDFGYFQAKDLPEIELWERYLVYATVFGIADKVQKEMKIKIRDIMPDYESNTLYRGYYWDYNMARIINSSVRDSFKASDHRKAIVNARNAAEIGGSSMSSGGGFGGGSSFGGGGFGGGGSGGGRF